MLSDQELLNLPPREPVEVDNNVFEDACNTPPVSPRPTPGIILTVEGSPEIIDVGRHRSTRRSSRRTRQASSSQHRSPSGSRMNTPRQYPQQQQNGHRLRDPYLSGSGVSRSQSMRTARRPQSVDPTHRFRHRISSIPNDMTLPCDGLGGQRLASNQSLPLPDDEDVLRLRNFAVTSKGVVNRGDSFRSKSRSSHSVVSMGVSGQIPVTPTHQKDVLNVECASACAQEVVDAETIVVEGASATPTPPKNIKYRVLVLGPPDVGKTALVNQFMTSEYMCAYDSSQGKNVHG